MNSYMTKVARKMTTVDLRRAASDARAVVRFFEVDRPDEFRDEFDMVALSEALEDLTYLEAELDRRDGGRNGG